LHRHGPDGHDIATPSLELVLEHGLSGSEIALDHRFRIGDRTIPEAAAAMIHPDVEPIPTGGVAIDDAQHAEASLWSRALHVRGALVDLATVRAPNARSGSRILSPMETASATADPRDTWRGSFAELQTNVSTLFFEKALDRVPTLAQDAETAGFPRFAKPLKAVRGAHVRSVEARAGDPRRPAAPARPVRLGVRRRHPAERR
jgi:hypothetical protein